MNNISHIRSPNDLASRIKDDQRRCAVHDKGWRQAAVDLCHHLAVAREREGDNHAFGIWLEANGIDMEKNERAAAVQIGADLEVAQRVISRTDRRSLRMIADNELQAVIEEVAAERLAVEMEKVETTEIPVEGPETDEAVPSTGNNIAEPPASKPKRRVGPLPKADRVINLPEAPVGRKLADHGWSGEVVSRFFRPGTGNKSEAREMFTRLLVRPHCRPETNDVLRLLATGDYGPGHDRGNCTVFGPRMIFPELPLGWEKKVWPHKEPTAKAAQELAVIMPRMLELRGLLAEKKPADPDRFAIDWWYPQQQAYVVAPRAYAVPSGGDPHFAPAADEDIVVCGQVLRAKGQNPEMYAKQYAAFRVIFDHIDRNYVRTGDTVATRGYEYRRISPWFKVGDPVYGQMIWDIGHAMATKPELFEETRAARQVMNLA